MPNYVPPADKSNGQTLDAVADWNGLKNALGDYLNNGGIGNSQVSSNPSERIAGSKVDLGGGVLASAHAARHAPGGADELNDLDIANSGTPVSAHASRHAAGGADALPAGSIAGSQLAAASFTELALEHRKNIESVIAGALKLTYTVKAQRQKDLPNLDAHPGGYGVVRSGKVYFACLNRDYVIEWDHVADTIATINLTSGDHPGGLVRVGDDIYVICNDSFLIKKINISNAVSTAVNLATDGPASGAWTKVNALTRNGDGTVLFTLSKITGTFVSRLLRVVPATPSVTHAWDAAAGNYLAVPCFAKTASGTEYIVVYLHTNPGATAVPTIERRLASDLTAAGSLSLGSTTNLVNVRPIGFDGRYYYVWDTVIAGGPLIRVFDVLAATMLEVAQFAPGGGPTGAPNAIDTVPRSDDGVTDGGAYGFFDGRQLLVPAFLNATIRPVALIVPTPSWHAAYAVKLNDDSLSRVTGFATDGEFIFAVCHTTTTNARVIRFLA